MSHFAKVENGIVTQVVVAEQEWVNTQPDPASWVQTSYNTRAGVHYDPDGNPDGGVALRGNYAGIGMIYDSVNDKFYHTQPYPSWTLDHTIWAWVPPTPLPEDVLDFIYTWDEENKVWIKGEPKTL
jgi:hypothetical protein